MGRMDQNGFSPANFGRDCGCENNGCEECGVSYVQPCCDAAPVHEPADCGTRRPHQRRRGCEQDDGTHVFFESCDGAKEICVTETCGEELCPGRVLDVTATVRNVCPGRRGALGITVTEVDENGAEYGRGFQAITVPAQNGRCNQDVQVDPVRFILPEDQALQQRRHFIVRTRHHYVDAANIWNNSWGR